MLNSFTKYIFKYLFPKKPFEKEKPKKYIGFDEYDEMSDRQKVLLHSKYDVYLLPLYIQDDEDDD